jgi:hypothetical protein
MSTVTSLIDLVRNVRETCHRAPRNPSASPGAASHSQEDRGAAHRTETNVPQRGRFLTCAIDPRIWRAIACRRRESNGGGGGNRTLCRPFPKMAAMSAFRGQSEQKEGVARQLVVLMSPRESPPVLPSLGEIVESGGKGVPPAVASREELPFRNPPVYPIAVNELTLR